MHTKLNDPSAGRFKELYGRWALCVYVLPTVGLDSQLRQNNVDTADTGEATIGQRLKAAYAGGRLIQ